MTPISVIIPTFNRSKKVCRAVSSVLSQNFTDLEIIVVDDGSTDETVDSLARIQGKINLIRHTKNMGVSAARNTGIRASKGRLISFLDSDDYWLPEKLETQVNFFRKNRDIYACQTDEIWIRNGSRVNPMKKHLKPSGHIFERSLELCLVSPSAVMLKRSLLDDVGMFDEDLPVCEDYDLWLRISCKYPVHLIKKKLVVKEGGAPDQLSSSRKGMDRFRIKAMVKILESGGLNNLQIRTAYRELEKKCRIYGEGCRKRGRIKEYNYYLKLPEKVKKASLY